MLILTKYIELNYIERFKVQPQNCSKAKTRSASCQGNSPKNIPTGAPEICNVPGLGKQAHLLSFTSSCIHKSGQNTSFCDLLRNGRTSAPGLRCWLFWTLPSSSAMLFVGVYKDLLFMKAYQGVVLVVSEENRSFFSKLLPDAKLSAISTHSGHWSPLIGFLKARCWKQRNCCMFFGIFQFQDRKSVV